MTILYTEEIPSSEQIYSLYEVFGWNKLLNLSEEQLKQAMDNSWYVISAYNEEGLVGSGRLISDGIINAYLCGLVVHPEYQKLGVGSEIVKKLVNKGRSQNLHIELFCTDEHVKYYEKFGFGVFAQGMKDNW